MRKWWAILGAFVFMAGPGGAQAQVDLSALDRELVGPRAQVLVLGSWHLAELGDGFDPASLEPVLERLAAFAPEVIAIEALSGQECDLYARHPEIYPAEGVGRFCRDTGPARRATGLDVPAAIAQVRRTLRDWPDDPTPAQRRRLAALYLASGEAASALAQWLQLPAAERRAGDGVDEALAAELERIARAPSESYQIGARLAARLGVQRVHPTDDHTGDNIDVPEQENEAFGAALTGAWETAASRLEPLRRRNLALGASGDMLALYRNTNDPRMLRTLAEGDFGSAQRVAASQPYGRYYVAGWETRNLRMVANVRETFRERIGARVLVIVGANHKAWFDSLLGQMQGVDIVDAQQVLGGDTP